MKSPDKMLRQAYDKFYGSVFVQKLGIVKRTIDKAANYIYVNFYSYRCAQKGAYGELIEPKNGIEVYVKGYNSGGRHFVSFKNKKLFKIVNVKKTNQQEIESINFETGRVYKSKVTSDAIKLTRNLTRRFYELLPDRKAGLQLSRNRNWTLHYNGQRWDRI